MQLQRLAHLEKSAHRVGGSNEGGGGALWSMCSQLRHGTRRARLLGGHVISCGEARMVAGVLRRVWEEAGVGVGAGVPGARGPAYSSPLAAC